MPAMAELTIYHNPRCTKSRQAMQVLEDRGVDATVVRYLDEPPSRATLDRILDKLEDPPADLVRRDRKFKDLGLKADDYTTAEAVAGLLAEHPEMMQRPVLETDDRAVIGRPTERVDELLEASP